MRALGRVRFAAAVLVTVGLGREIAADSVIHILVSAPRQDQDLCRVQCASLSGNFSAAFTCSELCDSIKMLRPLPIFFGRAEPKSGVPHYKALICSNYASCNWPLIHWVGLWCIGILCDVGVIYYHISVPPHPKFLLRLPRRMSIRDHTVSGVVEIVAGVCAFCWNDPTYPLYVQLVAAVFFHIPSDIYQTPNVFGVRIIMVPAYALVVALKLLCAINLWLDMYSMQKLLMLVIIHHIYVWCRVFMAIFTTARVMQAHEYTVSILLAGFICLPAVLGPTGNIMAMMVLVFYMLIMVPLCNYSEEKLQALRTESHRDMFANNQFNRTLDSLHAITGIQKEGLALHAAHRFKSNAHVGQTARSPAALAQSLMHYADNNHNGVLEYDEVELIMGGDQISLLMKRALENRRARGVKIDVKVLERLVQQHCLEAEMTDYPFQHGAIDVIINAKTEHLQAKCIFCVIDADNSGYLEVTEISKLLSMWGMPVLEALETVRAVSRSADENHDDKISFDEFQICFRPLWKYAYHDMHTRVLSNMKFLHTDDEHVPQIMRKRLDTVYVKKSAFAEAAAGSIKKKMAGNKVGVVQRPAPNLDAKVTRFEPAVAPIIEYDPGDVDVDVESRMVDHFVEELRLPSAVSDQP